jgi:hypothetical protein
MAKKKSSEQLFAGFLGYCNRSGRLAALEVLVDEL